MSNASFDSAYNIASQSGGSAANISVSSTATSGVVHVLVWATAGASTVGTTAPTSAASQFASTTFTKTTTGRVDSNQVLDVWEGIYTAQLSSTTITITPPTSTTVWRAAVVVYAGGAKTDASASAIVHSTNPSSPSITTASSNELVVSYYAYSVGPNPSATAGTGYTVPTNVNNLSTVVTYTLLIAEYANSLTTLSGTAVSPGWTLTPAAGNPGILFTVAIPNGIPAPGTPAAPTLVTNGTHSIVLGMPGSLPTNTTSLDLQQSSNGGSSWTTIQTNVTLSSNVTVNGLSSNFTYLYRMMAQGGGGSTPSSNLSVTTLVGVNLSPYNVTREIETPEEPIQPKILTWPPPGNLQTKNGDGTESISSDTVLEFVGNGAAIHRTGLITQVRVNAGPAWWNSLASYVPGQIITGADLNLYRCTAAHMGVEPTTDSGTYWQAYAIFGPMVLYCGSGQRFSGSSSDPAGIVQALNFIQSAILPAPSGTTAQVTIQVANGTYAYTTNTINITHPYGNCFQILGNTTTPASCTVTGTQSGTAPLIHVIGNNPPLTINGFTLTGPSTSNGVGVQGTVNLGANMTIQTWQFGIDTGTAVSNSSGPCRVFARSLTISGCGTGIQCRFGGYVDAASATVKSCTTGILATSGGNVRTNGITFTSNTSNTSPGIGVNSNDNAYIGQTY